MVLLLFPALGAAQDFTLRPHDRVRISSTGDRTLACERTLAEDGGVLLESRTVFLAGRSLEESATEISRSLGPAIGRVGVELLSPTTGSVSYRGAVKRSGTIGIRSPKTIADILEIAEPTDAADRSGIIVISALGKSYKVDVDADPKFALRPGDQVLVPQAGVPNQVLVLGAVKSPGSYPFRPKLTLEEAVELSGGLTGHAISSQITVLRRDQPVPGATWTEEGKKSVLQRGDVIRVASQENGRYISVIGHVKTPGLVPYKPGMTLMEAIEAAGGTAVGAGRDAVEIRKVFSGQGKSRKIDINLLKKGSPKDPKLQAADVVFVPAFIFKEPKPAQSGFRPVVPPRRSR